MNKLTCILPVLCRQDFLGNYKFVRAQTFERLLVTIERLEFEYISSTIVVGIFHSRLFYASVISFAVWNLCMLNVGSTNLLQKCKLGYQNSFPLLV